MAKIECTILAAVVLLLVGVAANIQTTSSPNPTTSGGTASCPSSKYRSIDSSCSTRTNSEWGKANQPFARMLPPNYADGISRPAVMLNGSEYVSARSISTNVFGINEIPDPNNTILSIFFLNAIANDLSAVAVANNVTQCCTDGHIVPNAPSSCYPVQIPADDPMYSWFKISCLGYVRAPTGPVKQPPQPVQQINSATSTLDLSFLYGTSVAQSNNLRTMAGGRLQSVRRSGVDWPVADPAGCTGVNVCYLVADSRMYQFPMTATIHLIFLREHNRLANQFKLLNPSWSDEVLFQEARRLNIAQYQYIVYYHYLPRVLGRLNMISNGLIFEGTGFTQSFNAFQDPSSLGEFGNVVVPFMQSQIPGSINSYVNGTIESMPLSSLAGNLTSLESSFAFIYAGLITQSANQMVNSFSIEWKNFMYRGAAAMGQDFLALDIQRTRDFGFASYNDYRSRCGLSRFKTWEAFNSTLKVACLDRLRSMYSSIDDMDLFVGAAVEKSMDESMVGPTFACLFKQQFLATRAGDRYFFEEGGQEGSFTDAQLAEIRKTSIARLMCNALPTTPSIQPDAFCPVLATNVPTTCSALPNINLSLWKV